MHTETHGQQTSKPAPRLARRRFETACTADLGAESLVAVTNLYR